MTLQDLWLDFHPTFVKPFTKEEIKQIEESAKSIRRIRLELEEELKETI